MQLIKQNSDSVENPTAVRWFRANMTPFYFIIFFNTFKDLCLFFIVQQKSPLSKALIDIYQHLVYPTEQYPKLISIY